MCFIYRKEQFFVPIIIVLQALIKDTHNFIYNRLMQGMKGNNFFKGYVWIQSALIYPWSCMMYLCDVWLVYLVLQQQQIFAVHKVWISGFRFINYIVDFCHSQLLVDIVIAYSTNVLQHLGSDHIKANVSCGSCVENMLRQASKEGLDSQKKVLKYLGQRLRIKVLLPAWFTDVQVANFLIRYSCFNQSYSLLIIFL